MKSYQGINKNKKTSLLLFMTIMLVFCMVGVVISAGLSKPATVSAASTDSLATYLKAPTSKKTFKHYGSTYDIYQYYDSLYGNNGANRVGLKMVFNKPAKVEFFAADPITSLIPLEVFDNLRVRSDSVFTYMGEQWGVIIDHFKDSENITHFIVQVIDIITANNIAANEEYTVEIRPLFEVEFAWISSTSGTINNYITKSHSDGIYGDYYGAWFFVTSYVRTGSGGVYALPRLNCHTDALGTLNYTWKMKNTKRNYINNVLFEGVLMNEFDANPGHKGPSGFVADQDYGAYFSRSDMEFIAYDVNSLNNSVARIDGGAAIKAFAGLIPSPYALDVVLFIWDITDLITAATNAVPDTFESFTNYSSKLVKYNKSSHDAQTKPIEAGGYGRLIKDCHTAMNNDNLALSLHGTKGASYAKGIYGISQERKPISANPTVKENRYWAAQLDTHFSFDIRRYNPSQSNFKQSVNEWQNREFLNTDSANFKSLEIGQSTIYNYYQNTSRLTFTAPTAGYYRMYFADRIHDKWYKNFSTSELYLNAGQKHEFLLKYLNSDITTSELIIEKTDLKFTLTNNGTAYSVRGLSSVSHINIPATFRGLPVEIGTQAFINFNNLQTVVISEGITSISSGTFFRCASLISITIPSSVTSISSGAFSGCTSLSNISLPQAITSIENRTFENCTNLTSITIPHNVTSIGSYAFAGCTSLIGIIIPNTVANMGNNAFAECIGLTDITIPDSITSISDSAFFGCTNLENIIISEGVTSIGIGTFVACTSLISITIPSTVISIGDGAFYYCTGLTSIVIPEGVTSIGRDAFGDCTSLISTTIPSTVINIGDYSFYRCTNLTNVIISEGVTSIGDAAFRDCTSLVSIVIPGTVESIKYYSFAFCTSLESIIISEGVISIYGTAFWYCTSLTSITIPKSVTSIGRMAFADCTSLTSMYILRPSSSNITSTEINLFLNSPIQNIYTPTTESVDAYKMATNWSNYSSLIKLTPYPIISNVLLISENITIDTIQLYQYIAYSLPISTRQYYDFLGWNTLPDGTGTTYTSGSLWQLDTDITLYAQWRAYSYAVTFDSQGGDAVNSMQLTYGAPYNLPITYYGGGEFIGWNTLPDGTGTTYTYGNSWPLTSSITLYAQWQLWGNDVTFFLEAGQPLRNIYMPYADAWIGFNATISQPGVYLFYINATADSYYYIDGYGYYYGSTSFEFVANNGSFDFSVFSAINNNVGSDSVTIIEAGIVFLSSASTLPDKSIQLVENTPNYDIIILSDNTLALRFIPTSSGIYNIWIELNWGYYSIEINGQSWNVAYSGIFEFYFEANVNYEYIITNIGSGDLSIDFFFYKTQ